jgi:3-dehydroquinate synthase
MVCAMRLGQVMGVCGADLVEAVTCALARAGLPVSLPAVDVDAIWRLMQSDKKKRGGKVRFALLRAPGDAFVTSDVDEQNARRALASLASPAQH